MGDCNMSSGRIIGGLPNDKSGKNNRPHLDLSAIKKDNNASLLSDKIIELDCPDFCKSCGIDALGIPGKDTNSQKMNFENYLYDAITALEES